MGNLLKGTQGLGKTFWLWFVAIPMVLALLFYGALFFTLGFGAPLFRLLDVGFMAFIALWEVLTGIAVLRTATYERERGLWGWTASVVASIAITGTLLRIGALTLVIINPPPTTADQQWQAFQVKLQADRAALPKKFSDGRTLTATSVDAESRALTYAYDVAAPTIPDPAAYAKKLKAEEITRCAEHRAAFTSGATAIQHVHKARDQSLAKVSLVPKDCGVSVAPTTAPMLNKNAEVPPPAEVADGEPKARKPLPRLALPEIREAIEAAAGDAEADIKPVVAQLRTMAGKGDTLAQVFLGDLYLKGGPVIRNYPMAAYWYEEAAKKGNTEAQFKLAGLYRDNVGVVQTGEAAQDWLIRAAAAGHVEARRMLLEWGVEPPPIKPLQPMKPKKKSKKGDAEKEDAAAEEDGPTEEAKPVN